MINCLSQIRVYLLSCLSPGSPVTHEPGAPPWWLGIWPFPSYPLASGTTCAHVTVFLPPDPAPALLHAGSQGRKPRKAEQRATKRGQGPSVGCCRGSHSSCRGHGVSPGSQLCLDLCFANFANTRGRESLLYTLRGPSLTSSPNYSVLDTLAQARGTACSESHKVPALFGPTF